MYNPQHQQQQFYPQQYGQFNAAQPAPSFHPQQQQYQQQQAAAAAAAAATATPFNLGAPAFVPQNQTFVSPPQQPAPTMMSQLPQAQYMYILQYFGKCIQYNFGHFIFEYIRFGHSQIRITPSSTFFIFLFVTLFGALQVFFLRILLQFGHNLLFLIVTASHIIG